MILAKISEEEVGNIFGPQGRVIRELEERFQVQVDARETSDDGKWRLIGIAGNLLNACGILNEFVHLVGSSNIIISPKLPGQLYTYFQSVLNPIPRFPTFQAAVANHRVPAIRDDSSNSDSEELKVNRFRQR